MPYPSAEAQSKGGRDDGVKSFIALGVFEIILVISPAIECWTHRRRGGFVVKWDVVKYSPNCSLHLRLHIHVIICRPHLFAVRIESHFKRNR